MDKEFANNNEVYPSDILHDIIAPDFNPLVSYEEGDIVIYNGAVYCFKDPFEPVWSANRINGAQIRQWLNDNAIRFPTLIDAYKYKCTGPDLPRNLHVQFIQPVDVLPIDASEHPTTLYLVLE